MYKLGRYGALLCAGIIILLTSAYSAEDILHLSVSRVPQTQWQDLFISVKIQDQNHQVLTNETIPFHDSNLNYNHPLDDVVTSESYDLDTRVATSPWSVPSKLTVTIKSKDYFGHIINEQIYEVLYNGGLIQAILWPGLTSEDVHSHQDTLLFDPLADKVRSMMPRLPMVHLNKRYYQQRPFVDLKPQQFYQVSDQAKRELEKICGLNHPIWSIYANFCSSLATYETMDKSDAAQIQGRIDHLREISGFAKQLSDLLSKIDQKLYKILIKQYELLALNADNKCQYLEKLARLLNSKEDLAFLKPNEDKDPLKQRGLFDSQGNLLGVRCLEYYWLDDLDPAHRRWGDHVLSGFMHPLYTYWQSELSSVFSNFFLMLEGMDEQRHQHDKLSLSRKFDRLVSQYIFDQAFKEENHLQIHDGKLVSPSNQLLTTGAWEYCGRIYVMDMAGELYMPLSSRFNNIRHVHHNMLLEGGYALSAGHIKSDNGKIFLMNNDSGHYHIPSHLFIRAVKNLHKKGVFHAQAEIAMYVKGMSKYFSLDQFLTFTEEDWEKQIKQIDQTNIEATISTSPESSEYMEENEVFSAPGWDSKFNIYLSTSLQEFLDNYNLKEESILSVTGLTKERLKSVLENFTWINFEHYVLPDDFKSKVYGLQFLGEI